MKAIIITIGDEILIGQIVDTNSAWLGQKMNEIGIDIIEKIAIGDDHSLILKSIDYAFENADLILMTGGLGPTKDDITKHAIAEYFNVGLTFSQPTYDRIVKLFERFNRPVTKSLEEQCYLPSNATLLKNKMGTAPGMLFQKGEKLLIAMPGVPYEMQSIVSDELIPILQQKNTSDSILHSTIMTAGEGETVLADKILPKLTQLPDHIKLAYLPSLGSVRLRLTGKSGDKEILQQELNHFTKVIVDELGDLVYGFNDESLEAHILRICVEKNITLSTAESCTGGYLAHKLTSIPGSSAYFMGSIVSYANEIKTNVLKVKQETLDIYGAVSEETVKEMLSGLLNITNTTIGVSISGIAGPDGGSPEKPVGTIWLALGTKDQIQTFKLNSTKDRLKNIEYATTVAMNKLRLLIATL